MRWLVKCIFWLCLANFKFLDRVSWLKGYLVQNPFNKGLVLFILWITFIFFINPMCMWWNFGDSILLLQLRSVTPRSNRYIPLNKEIKCRPSACTFHYIINPTSKHPTLIIYLLGMVLPPFAHLLGILNTGHTPHWQTASLPKVIAFHLKSSSIILWWGFCNSYVIFNYLKEWLTVFHFSLLK